MRKFIIKMLGGFTKQELEKVVITATLFGRESVLGMIDKFADELYETPGDEWAHEMYEFIQERIQTCPKLEVTFGKSDCNLTMKEEVSHIKEDTDNEE